MQVSPWVYERSGMCCCRKIINAVQKSVIFYTAKKCVNGYTFIFFHSWPSFYLIFEFYLTTWRRQDTFFVVLTSAAIITGVHSPRPDGRTEVEMNSDSSDPRPQQLPWCEARKRRNAKPPTIEYAHIFPFPLFILKTQTEVEWWKRIARFSMVESRRWGNVCKSPWNL